jgi:hypothetical protein
MISEIAIEPIVKLPAATDKDLPLCENIRLLGCLLGVMLQEQKGQERFALIENIRQAAVRFHRDHDYSANHAAAGQPRPKHLSTNRDPLIRFHRWLACAGSATCQNRSPRWPWNSPLR